MINWYNRFYANILKSNANIFNFYEIINNPNYLVNNIKNIIQQEPQELQILNLDKNKNKETYNFLSEDDERLKLSFELYRLVLTKQKAGDNDTKARNSGYRLV